MPRTLADYLDIAEHAHGGQVDAAVKLQDLVNDAGRYLVSMHEWSFLERPQALLGLVASQAYVSLPADFGKLIALGNTADYDYHASRLVPADRFERIRASGLYDALNTFLSLEWPTQADTAGNAPGPRLAVYPVPSADAPDRFWLNYYAGWTTLNSNAAVPNIPAGVEPLLVQLVRAFAAGEASGAGPFEAIELLERSQMFRSMKRAYGLVNPAPAPMEGGIGHVHSQPNWRRHTTITYTP